MSIHKRLAEVHLNLMNMKIEKSGWNGHKKFHYYELEDIMGPIIKECAEKEITVEFPYCEDVAILKLVDWNNPKDYVVYRVAIPEVIVPEKNPNNQIVQTLGANISYLQRYLLKLAFPCLSDKDIVDSGDGEEPTTVNSEKTTEPETADINVGLLIVDAEKRLRKKGLTDEEITPRAIKMEVRRLQKWSPSEMRTINNYFKDKEGF